MGSQIRHTTDWRFSTIASWLGVTCACAYYANSSTSLLLQLPVSVAILLLLFYVIKNPNKHVVLVAVCYLLLILSLVPLSTTTLLFIHAVMFSAVFSPHFSFPKVMLFVSLIMFAYGLYHFERWQGEIPWITFVVWFFFCSMNWFVSRRIVESLNMHYESRQNYKELQAAQHMMAIMSAAQTRQHISRELHDSLGHKLTALSINLDFTKRVAPNDVAKSLETCHQLSQEVLSEVRDIVSVQRNDSALLAHALKEIIAMTPRLRCDLALDVDEKRISQQHTLCIVRFCQEMISNTLKHTQAKEFFLHVSVEVRGETELLVAKAWHSQKESKLPKAGNGLVGLTERMAQFGGHFEQSLENSQLLNVMTLPLELGKE
ncbi:sensor histidine kinase [Pseudoalteromonas luteoviolacea]|uniref:sensor histidine kinase n=1 Tax=Pseudoalteromonas luteoviolacea TaxID=43657 RepID=UPI001B367102|nr:histidine kinase [Pseudoalteromonas luteoviolacea]MBQ4837665.1 histidine kinase [Pseudoalteromonas luteoviolacea]